MTLEKICARVEAFIAGDASFSFDALASAVFQFQFENNAPYRAYCESCGVAPARLKSPADIPAIITSAFKELDLSAIAPAFRTTLFHSSGTTQHKPSRHFHSPRTLRVYEQSLLRWFKPNILPERAEANFLILAPRSAEAPHSSLVHMFETVARKFGAPPVEFCAQVTDQGWSVDFEKFLATAEKLSDQDIPTVVCGTAFSFVHLCDFLSANRRVPFFPPGSRVFETGGYKGRSRLVEKAKLHAMISERLGIPESNIMSEYGMSELSSQAYDRKTGFVSERIYQFPPWVGASILSPESGQPVREGETGLLRVLDLANVGSVMAIQTEDLARRRGDGFQLLGRAALAEPRGCSLMQARS